MSKYNNLFLGLVYSLQNQAKVLLGKIENPHTGRIEENRELARINIELLETLVQKTMGNLTPEEESVIYSVIRELNSDYMQETIKYN